MTYLKVILFTILINWSISMQMLNQVAQNRRQKFIAVILALLTAAGSATIILI